MLARTFRGGYAAVLELVRPLPRVGNCVLYGNGSVISASANAGRQGWRDRQRAAVSGRDSVILKYKRLMSMLLCAERSGHFF